MMDLSANGPTRILSVTYEADKGDSERAAYKHKFDSPPRATIRDGRMSFPVTVKPDRGPRQETTGWLYNPLAKRGSRARYRHRRVSPPSRFARGSFRPIHRGGKAIVLGCPSGKYDHKHRRCRVSMRAQSVLTPKENPYLAYDPSGRPGGVMKTKRIKGRFKIDGGNVPLAIKPFVHSRKRPMVFATHAWVQEAPGVSFTGLLEKGNPSASVRFRGVGANPLRSPIDTMEKAGGLAKDDRFGFFGTVRTLAESGRDFGDFEPEVGFALGYLARNEKEAIAFLRSRMGRHLADELDATDLGAKGRSVEDAVKSHLQHFRSTGGKMMGANPRRVSRRPSPAKLRARRVSPAALAIEERERRRRFAKSIGFQAYSDARAAGLSEEDALAAYVAAKAYGVFSGARPLKGVPERYQYGEEGMAPRGNARKRVFGKSTHQRKRTRLRVRPNPPHRGGGHMARRKQSRRRVSHRKHRARTHRKHRSSRSRSRRVSRRTHRARRRSHGSRRRRSSGRRVSHRRRSVGMTVSNPRRRRRVSRRRHRGFRLNPLSGGMGKIVKHVVAAGVGFGVYYATKWAIGKIEALSKLSPMWHGVIIAGVGAALGFGVYTYFKSTTLGLVAAAIPVALGLYHAWKSRKALPAPSGAAASEGAAAAATTKGIGDMVTPQEAAFLPDGTKLEDPTTGEQYVVGDPANYVGENWVGTGNGVGISTPLAMVGGTFGNVGISTPMALVDN